MNNNRQDHDIDLGDKAPAIPFHTFVLLLFSAAAGASAAITILPKILPAMSASLEGSTPQAFWFMSRSSAIVAYILLWLSMVFGVMITNKMARVWPGGPAAVDLHEYASLLGMVFAVFHGMILMGDHYIHFSLGQVFVPFANPAYRPLWVGIGQLNLYLWAVIAFSFYVRRRITPRRWRLIHYLSFLSYLMGLFHGIYSGTDTPAHWAHYLYWASGALLLFLFIYRILTVVFKPSRKTVRLPAQVNQTATRQPARVSQPAHINQAEARPPTRVSPQEQETAQAPSSMD